MSIKCRCGFHRWAPQPHHVPSYYDVAHQSGQRALVWDEQCIRCGIKRVRVLPVVIEFDPDIAVTVSWADQPQQTTVDEG